MGVEVQKIMILARRSSNVVLRCVADPPLATITSDSRRLQVLARHPGPPAAPPKGSSLDSAEDAPAPAPARYSEWLFCGLPGVGDIAARTVRDRGAHERQP
eukprot:NODE_12263_length_1236_cov_2.396754.p4 GENE.NODE_12263_length_1236_cov_2.396754~~NODE_12263_length_1236_cov_2.396754.p4  ORF type:complete len:101 (+),score=20.16 NODE_12263_length_1236_cov_2.396754:579-881(+)